MINMFNVIKNETIKFINEKKLYIILGVVFVLVILGVIAYKDMINNVMTGDARVETYSQEFITTLQNFNGLAFSKMFLSDFIYKPYFSIYLIFISIIAVNIFSNDYKSGNLKFALLTNTTVTQLYLGKVLFMMLVSTLIVSINFLLSLIVGQIAFGGSILMAELLEVIALYFISVIPAVVFSLIISLISLTKLSPNVIIGGAIGVIILFGIIDTLTKFKYISPIGILSFFEQGIPAFNNSMIINLIIGLIYMILLSMGLVKVTNKVDY